MTCANTRMRANAHARANAHNAAAIPLLVLGNKNDVPDAMSVDEIIDKWYVV